MSNTWLSSRSRVYPLARTVVVALSAAVLLVAACQPADDPLETQGQDEQSAPDEPPVGVEAASGVPQTLGDLFDQVDETASEWQSGARPVEIRATMDDGQVASTQATFVGGGADRFLVIETDAEGVSENAPRLDGLELGVIPVAAVDAIEPPDELADPAELIELAAPALDECGLPQVTTVLYTTGAPAAWTGESWASEPVWRGILRAGDDGTAHVDPRSGELAADGCR